MNQPLSAIGTIETIALPDYNLNDVLAKIDTGADSSAIWASNIIEHDGELRYTLFGPSSVYYSGEEYRTRRYSLVTVKNSFGQKEVRYKVSIKIKVADRIIKVRMTLANRSANRFPVLIGRRTLKGKFLVDAAKSNLPDTIKRIACLFFVHNTQNDSFIKSLRSDGIDTESFTYAELIFKTGGDGNKIYSVVNGQDVADFGLVYFSTSRVLGRRYISASIAQYLSQRKVDFIDSAVNNCPEQAKLYQYITLTDNNVPVPATLFMLPSRLRQSYERCAADLGSPFILKDNNGRKGKDNYLITTKAEFADAMRKFDEAELWPLAQQFIANECDYRLLVIGGEVTLVLKRIRTRSDTHLNNHSQGSKTETVDISSLPPEVVNRAVMSAKLLQLQIAGVDFVHDKQTKSWYCLEVNKSPQLFSGAATDEKMSAVAKYFSQRLFN